MEGNEIEKAAEEYVLQSKSFGPANYIKGEAFIAGYKTAQDLKIDKAIQYFEELRSDRERNREDDTILITTALIILKGIKRDGRK